MNLLYYYLNIMRHTSNLFHLSNIMINNLKHKWIRLNNILLNTISNSTEILNMQDTLLNNLNMNFQHNK